MPRHAELAVGRVAIMAFTRTLPVVSQYLALGTSRQPSARYSYTPCREHLSLIKLLSSSQTTYTVLFQWN